MANIQSEQASLVEIGKKKLRAYPFTHYPILAVPHFSPRHEVTKGIFSF